MSCEWGCSSNFQRNTLRLNGVYQAPKGFSLSGIFYYGSGNYYSDGYATSAQYTSIVGGFFNVNRLIPNALETGSAAAAHVTIPASLAGRWDGPMVIQPGQTMKRDALEGTPLYKFDIRLAKDIRIRERFHITRMFKVFNLFNHPNYGAFQTIANLPAFGTPSRTAAFLMCRGTSSLLFGRRSSRPRRQRVFERIATMISRATAASQAVALIVLLSPAGWASDLILLHGHVYTANPKQPWAEAIAISGSRIDAVGSDDEISRRKDGKTRVVDLMHQTVIPGIIDSHTHMWFGALALHGFNLATPDMYIEPKDEALLISKIQQYAAQHPKDKVLFGRVQFPMTVSHELLDRAVPDRPVVIHAPTEHAYWVNRKALALANITEKPVADPELEKFVVRDSQGRPTGVLREAAMQLMERSLPPQPLSERMAWMREASLYMNSFGITSVTNATGNLPEIELYAALHKKGQLTVRIRMAFGTVGAKHSLTPQFLADLDKARQTYRDDWVSANLVKFFADGAGTAPLYEPAEYRNLVLELDKRGYQIMTHALSQPAVHMVLDAYEEIEKVDGARDRRLRVEHAINVPPPDLERFAKLSVTASMQSEFCCFVDAPGSHTNAWQTLEKSGANLAFGSDWPCTWPPDPMSAIQQSTLRVVRQLFTAPSLAPKIPKYAGEEERLTVQQAVDAYTRGGAYARFSDDHSGTLSPGKEADLAVLSQDVFSVPSTEIGKTRVMLTMVGGKTVFERKP
ncbi:MAG: amidohydrolase [Acidobacteriia bacterium]|nr:amidohydrolase [Terriglobia bacterium]